MENDIWTVKRILEWIEGYLAKHGDESPRLSAQWLVAEALGENEADDKRASVARLARIQNVLQALLRERVSIRRLDAILEALGDLNLSEPDADLWRALEYVRARMARFLSAQYLDADGALRVVMLEPETEDALAAAKELEKVKSSVEGMSIVKEFYIKGKLINIVVKPA